ncbi:formate dehydrogenase subunit gamma [Ramlibacter sp. AW1]|uniref:Formate dehydrogenase subunit gamma n=2 Tax=Ramlibacter aurantiacus TaxID=2801330 RepID=A0A936ZT28_9BURK|nr:formate dehydrogenase subunit gamma [Ramlibacter aurantiacus]
MLLGLAGGAAAQQVRPADEAPPPAATRAAPAAPADGGIRSQNIFDVKPDADQQPGYMNQSNAERNRVQPGNNAPLWRAVGNGVAGTSSLPPSQAPEAGVLIQPQVQYPGSRFTTAGEAWRQVRNIWIIPYGGALLLIMLGALAIFYFTKGPIGSPMHEGGRRIERFTPFERSAHWANAIAFVVLAISGLVMAFGRYILQPLIGTTLFGWLTYALKTLHNFVGPLFVVSMIIVFVVFVRDNLPQRGDGRWIFTAGGTLSKQPVPSHRFNAGEKFVFWIGVLLLGAIVIGSGLVMDMLIPGLLYDRGTMQVAHMIHAVAAVLMMVMFLGHIYMGTIGMRGAYRAMREGYVDDEWAREHHGYWHDDIVAGRIPAQRSTTHPTGPAAADVRPA